MRVDLSSRAKRDLLEIAEFTGASTNAIAAVWLEKMVEEVQGLVTFPQRGRLCDATSEYREIFYGKKPHVYRIVYRVREADGIVFVFRIRHGARRGLKLIS